MTEPLGRVRAAWGGATPKPEERGAERRCPTCGEVFGPRVVTCPKDGALLELASGDPLIGAVIAGAYRITEPLASGGMGQVYVAEHTRLDRRLVVKVLKEMQAHRKDAVARVEREARLTSRIQSEHVLQMVDFVRVPDGRPALVAPLLEGEDLQARLDRVGKMPIGEAVPLAMQICQGVSAAHAMDVVHRDLKPSNVFMSKQPNGTEIAVLVDFGVAKLRDSRSDITHTGALVGTPAYMAPEQPMGAAQVDHRADIYAVGAMLYHMLTGQPPYGKGDATATLMGLLGGDPPRARSIESSVPAGLESVLEHAMARDVGKRIGSAEELADRLAPFAQSQSPERGAQATGAVASPSRELSLEVGAGELSRRAKWARPIAVVRVLAASVLAGAWLAAFGAALVFHFIGEGISPGLGRVERLLLPAALPAVAGILVILGVGALSRRWRSTPAIEQLSGAAARAMSVGLIAYGSCELLLRTFYAVSVAPAVIGPFEGTVSLGAAAIVGITAFGRARRTS